MISTVETRSLPLSQSRPVSGIDSRRSAWADSSWASLMSILAFRNVPGEDLAGHDYFDPTHHVYSRFSQDVSTRAEKVLGKILVRANLVT